MNVRVFVTPKQGILDPQGAAVERSLPNLGFQGVSGVRIGKIIDLTMGMRISEDDEIAGVDLTTHAEGAYELADSGSGGKFAGVGQAALKKEEVTV